VGMRDNRDAINRVSTEQFPTADTIRQNRAVAGAVSRGANKSRTPTRVAWTGMKKGIRAFPRKSASKNKTNLTRVCADNRGFCNLSMILKIL
jgi:hypothetical protein